MSLTLAFDFREGLKPVNGKAVVGAIGDMQPPQGAIDPVRGLAFPLSAGGFALHSGPWISDAAGSLEVVFALGEKPNGARLIQAWGQYGALVQLEGQDLQVTHLPPMRVHWQLQTPYTLTLDWDHRTGITVTLKARGGAKQTRTARTTWQAFGQQHVPFCLGGRAFEPRYRRWEGSFHGHVRSLKVWSQPQQVPGPAAVTLTGERLAAPMAAAPGITVLEHNDPPIMGDPLKLDQLPDRLRDLRKTRDVCELDRLTAHCRSELEIFTMLTWHLGHLWPHTNYWPWDPDEQRAIFWKRGHEILPDIAAGKAGGMCGGYAHMMEEVFWAMGFDARRIQVRGHSSFEAYSNELDRWIICDASYNKACHLMGDGDNQPVGCRDVIRAFERLAFDPAALSGFHPLMCDRENLKPWQGGLFNDNYPRNPATHYDSVGLAMRKTDQYGRNRSTSRGDHRHAWYFQPCDRPSFAGDSAMGKSNQLVTDLDALYPSRNRCRVRATWPKRGETLALELEAVAVRFFDHFEITVDGQIQKIRKNRWLWKLHPGVNQIQVRTVNRLGARGYPWALTLHRRPT